MCVKKSASITYSVLFLSLYCLLSEVNFLPLYHTKYGIYIHGHEI